MSLFKKKKNLTRPNQQVYMPYKKNSITPVKRKKKFRLSNKKSSSLKRNKKQFNISGLFFYFVLPIILLSLLYASALFVIKMRNGGNENEYEEKYVIGIEGVPSYPDSVFIFENNFNEPSVANFISSGNSAYRLPQGISITDAYEYYTETLPSKGWTFVLSVDTGSEEMKDGEYWIKDGDGLRIYSKFNDIWYELITPEQANTGLRERVEREIERDLLLANQELQDLLPDLAWVIKIPKEYIISYKASSFKNLRLIEFKKLGTEEKTTLTPVGDLGTKVLDNFLRDYIEIINENTQREWGISNTILTYTNYGSALKGSINSDGEFHDVAVMPNTFDNIVYVLDSNKVGDPFFEYLFSNLEPQDTSKD